MSAGQYNITLEQGSTLRLPLQYSDAAGNPIPLTGAHLQVRPSKSSTNVLLDLTVGQGLTLDTDTATIGIELSDEQRDAAFSSGWYDLKVLFADGSPDRMLEGRFYGSRQVTA